MNAEEEDWFVPTERMPTTLRCHTTDCQPELYLESIIEWILVILLLFMIYILVKMFKEGIIIKRSPKSNIGNK